MIDQSRVTMSISIRLLLWLYECLWYLALPVTLIRLYWKGRRLPGYRQHVAERFGFYSSKKNHHQIWVHAVSVGETRAAAPLIEALIASGKSILLTHMTPTGRATGQQIFEQHLKSGHLQQVYLPYDVSWAVNAFYKHFAPQIGLIMETEVWPTLILSAQAHKVPAILVNARLSSRSAKRAASFGAIATYVYQSFTKILAQTGLDAKRYESLGLSNVLVAGNLKFDVAANSSQVNEALLLRKELNPGMQIVCAASTREGEEELIIAAWQKLKQQQADLKNICLLIVPRHPQRFDDVYASLIKAFPVVVRRSMMASNTDIATAINQNGILLGDSMGEMSFYYALSDFVVMGGSLQPLGGQNFIEACALGRPIILGKHTFNFQQASLDVIDAEAGLRVDGIDGLSQAMGLLFANHELKEAMSTNALDFANQHTGATQKILSIIQSSH